MTFTLPTIAEALAFFKWLIDLGISAITKAYATSKTLTEIAVIGFVAFLALAYFGFFSVPKVDSKDVALEKQVASLTEKIDRLSANIDALKAPVAVSPNTKKKLTK